MANAGEQRICIAARLTSLRHEAGIDGDPQNVVSGWDFRLSIASIQNKILPAQKKHVRVGPSGANSLIPRNTDRPTTAKLGALGRLSKVARIGIHVNHAKAALRGAPDETRRRIDELVKRVMPEVVMVMTRGELIQSVIGGYVRVGTTESQVAIADVWCCHGEAEYAMLAGCDAP